MTITPRSINTTPSAGDPSQSFTISRIWVVVAARDVSDLDQRTEDYCVRAYTLQAAAEDHTRRAGELAVQAEAYEPPPSRLHDPGRSTEEYLRLVHAAVPGLLDVDPAWRPGGEAPTRYRVEPLELEDAARVAADSAHRVVVHRAHPTGDQIIPRSVIEIDPTVPDPRGVSDRRPGEYPSSAIMAEDARGILGALTQSLPGGTIDRLTVLLLERKVSHFIVLDP